MFAPVLAHARYIGMHGGRGSAKSHTAASIVVEQSLAEHGKRTICIREVLRTLKESSKRLIEDEIQRLNVGRYFDVRRDEILTPGNGTIGFTGMQSHTAESIKSLEGYSLAWIDEAQMLSQRSLELLRPTIRLPGSTLMFSWNPRSSDDPIDLLLRGNAAPRNAIVVEANYHDNPWFPAELEAERAHDEEHNPQRYGHIWLGQYESDNPDSLWKWAWINGSRIWPERIPSMQRIVVGVDHAISNLAGSDEHGIIAAGIGHDTRGYVLEDASIRGTPDEWAKRTVALYDKWEADAIVIERNQGGDLVSNTLRAVRPYGLKIIEVVATRGKQLRAEPIAATYGLGRISHVGTMPELERQMTAMTNAGYTGKGSCDRLDACVYALTELLPRMGKPYLQEVREVVSSAVTNQSWMS